MRITHGMKFEHTYNKSGIAYKSPTKLNIYILVFLTTHLIDEIRGVWRWSVKIFTLWINPSIPTSI